MNDIDYEQLEQEWQLWPWIDDPSEEFYEEDEMDDQWHKLTQAAPELAAACEEMMVELDWQAECDRKAGGEWKATALMVLRAKAALEKAGIVVDADIGVTDRQQEDDE